MIDEIQRDQRQFAGDPVPLSNYSQNALNRVWSSVRFSWWLTPLMHRFPEDPPSIYAGAKRTSITSPSRKAPGHQSARNYLGLDL